MKNRISMELEILHKGEQMRDTISLGYYSSENVNDRRIKKMALRYLHYLSDEEQKKSKKGLNLVGVIWVTEFGNEASHKTYKLGQYIKYNNRYTWEAGMPRQ
jgi:hypothetical protein